MNRNSSHFVALYADDNKGDIELTLEAVKESHVDCRMYIVRDGTEVISFLNHQKTYIGSPHPDLIILDWNMPRMNGPEVIPIIRSKLAWMTIPIIIFTSSASEKHIRLAYETGANCYVVKPMDFDQYIGCMAAIIRFWSQAARIPET